MAATRLDVLKQLRELLSLFHTWSRAEATEIRNRAVRDVRQLLAAFPFLTSLYPTLDAELDHVHRRDINWSIWRALENEIRSEEAGSAGPEEPG